jgi:hypothetical protein
MCNEVLNGERFHSVLEARVVIVLPGLTYADIGI